MLITRYPIKVFEILIVALPKNEIKVPTPLVIKKDPEFLRARMKAAIADVQKLSPVRATCIYAFSFKNLTNLWKQSRQHLQDADTHLATELFSLAFDA